MADIILAVICTPIMFVAFLLWICCAEVFIDAVQTYVWGESRGIRKVFRRWEK